jgi:hypothetical protein
MSDCSSILRDIPRFSPPITNAIGGVKSAFAHATESRIAAQAILYERLCITAQNCSGVAVNISIISVMPADDFITVAGDVTSLLFGERMIPEHPKGYRVLII